MMGHICKILLHRRREQEDQFKVMPRYMGSLRSFWTT